MYGLGNRVCDRPNVTKPVSHRKSEITLSRSDTPNVFPAQLERLATESFSIRETHLLLGDDEESLKQGQSRGKEK